MGRREALALVAGLEDGAMMREPIQRRFCHFCAPKDGTPFFECQVFREDDRRSLIELSAQMEEQTPARLGERDIAWFIKDDAICAHELLFDPSGLALAFFLDEKVD